MSFYKSISGFIVIVFVLQIPAVAQLFDNLSRSGNDKPAYTPCYEFQVWKFIEGKPHEMFGAHICGLGDVNGDGGNDFAVSTIKDTTWIFFGGKAFDGQPKAFVLGGGWALVSGDFNGDGYPDIATADINYKRRLDPKDKGRVRIYLHNHTASMYDAEPNLMITGKEYAGELGRGMIGADVNGDGKLDLIIPAIGERPTNGFGRVYLYLGKTQLDTIPDHVFEDLHLPHGDWRAGQYGYALTCADLNGDKCDDLVIKGQEANINTSDLFNNYVIWYGNKTANYTTPRYDLSSKDYPFLDWWVFSAKIFGNNYSLLFTKNRGNLYDAAIIFGKDSLSSSLPDAIFPNPEKNFFDGGATWVTQVGDLNNDGYDDYFVSWWNVALGGYSQYLYLGGKILDTVAVAYFGILGARDHYSMYPIPLKDIDGDGIDEFGLDRWTEATNWNGVRIYRGDNKIKRTTNVESKIIIDPLSINIFPNPVHRNAEISVTLNERGNLSIQLVDLLGRVIKVIADGEYDSGVQKFSIDAMQIPTGNYFLIAAIKGRTNCKILSILK